MTLHVQLRPCPWCLRIPKVIRRSGQFRIACRNWCSVRPSTALQSDADVAAAAWNSYYLPVPTPTQGESPCPVNL